MSTVRRIPADRIVADYRNGVSVKLLAGRHRVPERMVQALLRQHGQLPPGPAKVRARRSYSIPVGIDPDRVAADYQAGATLVEIGDEHGVSAHTIARVLTSAGVKRRGPGRPPGTFTKRDGTLQPAAHIRLEPLAAELAAEYAAGRTLREIAEHHGTYVAAVRRVLADTGVKLRARTLPAKNGAA